MRRDWMLSVETVLLCPFLNMTTEQEVHQLGPGIQEISDACSVLTCSGFQLLRFKGGGCVFSNVLPKASDSMTSGSGLKGLRF